MIRMQPGEDPHHWGFEVNVAGTAAGGLATYLSEYNYGHDKSGNKLAANAIEDLEKYWGTGTFATEALTQEAIKPVIFKFLHKRRANKCIIYTRDSAYSIIIP